MNTFNMSLSSGNMIFLESLDNSFNLSLSIINFISCNSFCTIIILFYYCSCFFLNYHKTFIYHLQFICILLFQYHYSVIFSIFLCQYKYFLYLFTLLHLNTFNWGLSECWLDLVEVIKHLFSLDIFSQGFFWNNSDNW